MKSTPISQLPKKIAVDASILVYQLYMIGAKCKIHGSRETTINHLLGMFQKMAVFLSHGIRPLVVFDGKPPDLKADVLLQRKKRRDESQAAVKPPSSAFDEVRELLRVMGIAQLDAPGEAEAQCAYLVKQGVCDIIASDDSDAIVFGASMQVKNISKDSQVIDLQEVLAHLQMTMDQFIDYCILLGSDYAPTIPGIGPVTAKRLIKKHVSLEEVFQHVSVSAEQQEKLLLARKEFKNPLVHETLDIAREYKSFNPSEVAAVEEFLLHSGCYPKQIAKGLSLLREIKK